MSSNTGNIIAALVAGAVVGVGVGMLLAPDKGSETRKKIKDGFDSSKEDILDHLSDFVDGVKSKVKDVIPSIEDVLEKNAPTDKAGKEALIALLEKKLEALKTTK